ncbi:hypothetical protein BDN72DRAFT_672423 [Pluteus cervinus]|uniref:Uncharacterized protein n=1 Tax=Pluteus cervinus TaxID=181527 RepID=A0ACD3B9K5_9AGAR|nr:hypothetical protein BDN72DRAFT_672423 [Pluteus cervinus]
MMTGGLKPDERHRWERTRKSVDEAYSTSDVGSSGRKGVRVCPKTLHCSSPNRPDGLPDERSLVLKGVDTLRQLLRLLRLLCPRRVRSRVKEPSNKTIFSLVLYRLSDGFFVTMASPQRKTSPRLLHGGQAHCAAVSPPVKQRAGDKNQDKNCAKELEK